MKTFIDTCFITALVNEQDSLHAKALELSELYEGQRFILTDAILLEAGNALAKRYRPEVIAIIEQFQIAKDIEIVRLDPEISSKPFRFSNITKTRPGDLLTVFHSWSCENNA